MLTFDRDILEAQADGARLAKLRPNLETRSRMMVALRGWFAEHDFLEVESPVRLPAPALEDYIDAIPAGKEWLRTSPELHLKRLLAAGYERIFEMGPCFRAGESGSHHRTEFTMLEWYRRGGTWRELQEDTQGMLAVAVAACHPEKKGILPFRGREIDFRGKWPEITVLEAFERWGRMSLREAIATGEFENVLCEDVEPHLGMDAPVFLTEYPMECSGLSAALPGKPGFVARWELYIGGLEIGNACSELVDPPEQERRFLATAELRAREGREVYPMDQPFMNAIWNGLTPSAGTAIGLDRLAMVLCQANDIAEVRAF